MCQCNRLDSCSLGGPDQFEGDGALKEDLHQVEVVPLPALTDAWSWTLHGCDVCSDRRRY
jgi:hypothetical protein